MNTPTTVRWRKSSRSANNGQCVEVAQIEGSVSLRDSKLPEGTSPLLAVPTAEWHSLLQALRSS